MNQRLSIVMKDDGTFAIDFIKANTTFKPGQKAYLHEHIAVKTHDEVVENVLGFLDDSTKFFKKVQDDKAALLKEKEAADELAANEARAKSEKQAAAKKSKKKEKDEVEESEGE